MYNRRMMRPINMGGNRFGELTKIKECFVSILAATYHGRIKYQNQKDPDDTTDNTPSMTEAK